MFRIFYNSFRLTLMCRYRGLRVFGRWHLTQVDCVITTCNLGENSWARSERISIETWLYLTFHIYLVLYRHYQSTLWQCIVLSTSRFERHECNNCVYFWHSSWEENWLAPCFSLGWMWYAQRTWFIYVIHSSPYDMLFHFLDCSFSEFGVCRGVRFIHLSRFESWQRRDVKQ